ncbi:MAG: cob(I)yrinic acid a,c-diamide adenosyltransferase [Deltaproteobacteria bacterium]|nr:MAG: cob(I)yrinic acid a,c-diamide adenosyltransferase [Deltaproteobacteria bacterium]
MHVYTGDGKGKTTAAIGLAVRCAGAGGKVFIGQFVKGMHYAELDALRVFSDSITVEQFGRGCFIVKEPQPADYQAARQGLERCAGILKEGRHDLVVLDEANIAVYFGLFSEQELIDAIKGRSRHVEVVVTGRKAPERLLELADLVTEMREVKHYYTKGVQARSGVEK